MKLTLIVTLIPPSGQVKEVQVFHLYTEKWSDLNSGALFVYLATLCLNRRARGTGGGSIESVKSTPGSFEDPENKQAYPIVVSSGLRSLWNCDVSVDGVSQRNGVYAKCLPVPFSVLSIAFPSWRLPPGGGPEVTFNLVQLYFSMRKEFRRIP